MKNEAETKVNTGPNVYVSVMSSNLKQSHFSSMEDILIRQNQ